MMFCRSSGRWRLALASNDGRAVRFAADGKMEKAVGKGFREDRTGSLAARSPGFGSIVNKLLISRSNFSLVPYRRGCINKIVQDIVCDGSQKRGYSGQWQRWRKVGQDLRLTGKAA